MVIAVLEVMNGPRAGNVLRLSARTLVIGRSRSCEIRVASELASRRHCQLLVMPTGLFVEDLQSRNGTYLNEERLAERRRLEIGDHLRVAELELIVRDCPAEFPADEPVPLDPNKMTLDQLVEFDDDDLVLDDEWESAPSVATTIFDDRAATTPQPQAAPQNDDSPRAAARDALRKLFRK